MRNKGIIIAMMLIALIGASDAGYLTAKHFLGTPVPCAIVSGCETVLTSSYANILGIPVALLGTIFYLSIFILSILALDTRSERVTKLLMHLPWAGLLASLYFVGLQFFIIQALCAWCLFSALTSTSLFVLGQIALRKMKQPPIITIR